MVGADKPLIAIATHNGARSFSVANAHIAPAYSAVAIATKKSGESFLRILGKTNAPATAPTPIEATRIPKACGPPSRFLAT